MFPVQEFFLEHVLRFTDYVGQMPSSGTHGNGQNSNSALAAYMRSCQEYICSLCRSGPFKSPEELGTHCALCNGQQQMLVHGTSKGYNGVRKYTSAEELVRMLTAAAVTGQSKIVNGSKNATGLPARQIVSKSLKDEVKGSDVSGGEELEDNDVWTDVGDDEVSSDDDDDDV